MRKILKDLQNSRYKNRTLAKALELLDASASDLAKKLEINPGIVSSWLSETTPIPLYDAARVEKLTEGKVKAKDLNPKAYEEFQKVRKYLK